MLERHIKTQVEKRFKCKVCSPEFHLKWRLRKHQEIHGNDKVRFNTMKVCPYEELGCMFKHETASSCKFRDNCKRKLCKFKHKVPENKMSSALKNVPFVTTNSFQMLIWKNTWRNAMIFNVLSVTNHFHLRRKYYFTYIYIMKSNVI